MIYKHDPDANLDYGVDWTDWLSADESITESTWEVQEGLVRGTDEIGDGFTVLWLSGGTSGSTYLVTNHIKTSAGREDDRSITIIVSER